MELYLYNKNNCITFQYKPTKNNSDKKHWIMRKIDKYELNIFVETNLGFNKMKIIIIRRKSI